MIRPDAEKKICLFTAYAYHWKSVCVFVYNFTVAYIICIPIDGLEDHGFYFYFQKVGRKVPITGSRIEKEGRVSAGHGD
jgi:hypothetical protein